MEKNRNKAGVTISDGCDGILDIDASSENTVTIDATVTGEEKRLVRRWGDLRYVQAGIWGEQYSQADSMKYLELCDKYSIGWMRKHKPPAGRKTRLRAWQLLMLMAHEVRLWRQKCFCVTFDKSNKTYSASDFACRLVFDWNMIRCE